MKILVTGAAGFIGSHMAEKLKAEGHTVIGLDCFSPYYPVELKYQNKADLERIDVPVLHLDLKNPLQPGMLPDDIEVIYHFAAHPGNSAQSSFEDYLLNNVLATRHLLEYSPATGRIPYFINISTSSVYGLEATCPETAVPAPVSWYGVTKLAAEQLVLARVRAGQTEGTSVRLYSVYGPRERPDKLYSKLIFHGLRGEAFPLFSGSETHLRSFTYVGDSVDGLNRILQHREKCNGEIYNLGSEAEYSTAEGIKIIEEILGLPIPVKVMPPRSGDQLRTRAVIDKARRDFGYQPRTSLREGLTRQVEWYKSRPAG